MAEADKRLTDIAGQLDTAIKATRQEERRALYVAVQRNIAELKAKRVALGDSTKQMAAGRAVPLAEGDKLTAAVQKLVDALRKTAFAPWAAALEAEILTVEVANWRFMASRDQKDVATFRNSMKKAQLQIADFEKYDLPLALYEVFDQVKAGLTTYATAFEDTSTSLLSGNDIYYQEVVPLTVAVIGQMDAVTGSIQQAFTKTTAETNDRIAGIITIQETVAVVVAVLGSRS
jgi:hypothetical protein